MSKAVWAITLHKSTWMTQKIPSWFCSFMVTWCFVSQCENKLIGRGVFEYHCLSLVGEPLLPFVICTGLLSLLILTWTSLTKCAKNTQLTQVAWVCTCKAELEDQAKPGYSVFFSRLICSVNTSRVELLILLELFGTVIHHYHVVHMVCLWTWSYDKHTLSHAGGEYHGRCLSLASRRAVPPQLHRCACQPHLQIGMAWIALPLHGTVQGWIIKRT